MTWVRRRRSCVRQQILVMCRPSMSWAAFCTTIRTLNRLQVNHWHCWIVQQARGIGELRFYWESLQETAKAFLLTRGQPLIIFKSQCCKVETKPSVDYGTISIN